MPMQRIDKETNRQIVLRFLSVLILLFSFSTSIVGQTEESDESVSVVIPDQVTEQVVRRILGWYFKPRNKPKVIYLAQQGLQQSWLPTIKNIEFRLLSSEEIQQKGLEVHFFTKPEHSGNTYSIGFAFGDPSCDYFGHNWQFRISKQRVRLWESGSVGGGCISSP